MKKFIVGALCTIGLGGVVCGFATENLVAVYSGLALAFSSINLLDW